VSGGTIERLPADWTDEQVADLNAFENVLNAELDPEIPAYPVGVTSAHRDLREDPMHVWVARAADGEVIGSAWADAPTRENTHLVFTLIGVRADRRREGIGRALFDTVLEFTRGLGRTSLILGCDFRNDAAEKFAASLGATLAFEGHVNRLTIADVDRDEMQRWVDATRTTCSATTHRWAICRSTTARPASRNCAPTTNVRRRTAIRAGR
jgi:GNAT superfamily N-acetyltransferase